MRITIPTKFSLLGRTYSVRWATTSELKTKDWNGDDGFHSHEKAEIVIRPKLNIEYAEHVFLHEVVHALFEMTGKDKLSEDEELMDLMSGLLHQFLTSKTGNLLDS